jgi:hypothetical protein
VVPREQGRAGEPEEPDFEARWRELAAELGATPPADLEDWAPARDDAGGGRVVWGADPAALEATGSGPRDWSPPEEDEHFEPPDPPPVLGGNPVVVLAWTLLLAGLVAMFAWAAFQSHVPVLAARGGLVATVVGAGVLISRLPSGRRQDGPPDG